MFAVSAYFLITLDRQRSEVRAAGWLYLVASHAATLCLFAFFTMLAAHTGSWELGPMRDHPELAPLFWLALLGFGVKAGLFPLHIWLPSAHANAPSHVSAMLSGVTLKMGIYGLVRFSGWLPVPRRRGLGGGVPWRDQRGAGRRLCARAARSQTLARLSQRGEHRHHSHRLRLRPGGGAAGNAPGAGWRWPAACCMCGTMACSNPCCFWCRFGAACDRHAGDEPAGRTVADDAVDRRACSRLERSRFPGCRRSTDSSANGSCISACSTRRIARGPSAWAAIPAAILLGVTGALALACFVKVCGVVFLGAPRSAAAAHAHECGPAMRGAMLVLGAAMRGDRPGAGRSSGRRCRGRWTSGTWLGWTQTPVALSALGMLHVALAVLALAAGRGFGGGSRQGGLVRALTWDCAYALPTARMQYTAGSFAGIINGWFAWILRPERHELPPEECVPGQCEFLGAHAGNGAGKNHPAGGRLVMRVSSAARSLQHGRVQAYLLYLLIGVGRCPGW